LLALLHGTPRVIRALGWSIILWDTTFTLVLVSPDYIAIAQFAIGLAFHLSIVSNATKD